jgi:hypothetical protein
LGLKMKKLILIVTSILLSVVGCNHSNSILQPEDEITREILPKGRPILNEDQDDDLSYLYDSLKFSYGENIKSGEQLYSDFQEIVSDDDDGRHKFKSKYSKNFTVDGSKGAVLFVRKSWRNKENKKISLSDILRIPKGAHEGLLTFDMIFDLEDYAMELYPSPHTFNQPVIFDMNFRNINIPEGLNVDFTYMDGEEKLQYTYVNCSHEKGTLRVKGAQLHHFSRYGWTRTSR